MITLRPSQERGRTDIGWLDSRHSFSFGDYYDPAHLSFRSLRVINDDRVAAGAGFGLHPHRDMEILTYVLRGSLEHKDSLGNGSVLSAGEVQRMTAGAGVLHSEFNPSAQDEAHFLQIWLLPEKKGLHPGYEQRRFPEEEKRGQLRLIAARDGRAGAVVVHQDVDVYATQLQPGDGVRHALRPGRHAWVQVATGEATLNGRRLSAGDGAAVDDEPALELTGVSPAEVLVFDLG